PARSDDVSVGATPAPESSAFYENWQGPFRCPIDRRGGRHPPSCPKNRGSAPVAPPPPAPTPLLLLDELQKTPYVWTRLVPDRWADVATTRRPAARAHRWASRGRTSGQETSQEAASAGVRVPPSRGARCPTTPPRRPRPASPGVPCSPAPPPRCSPPPSRPPPSPSRPPRSPSPRRGPRRAPPRAR